MGKEGSSLFGTAKDWGKSGKEACGWDLTRLEKDWALPRLEVPLEDSEIALLWTILLESSKRDEYGPFKIRGICGLKIRRLRSY